MSVHTIHHVTAVTAQIGKNLEFYTNVLGLRLVKKSVNQDDVSAYHLFYADAVGTPGTDMTFFDWPNIGLNQPGLATIALTTFRIPSDSVEWWEARLQAAGCLTEIGRNDLARTSIHFTDPEGQRLELSEDPGIPGNAMPWTSVVAEKNAIRGIMGVDLESARPEMTRRVLTELLQYRPVKGAENAYEAGDESHYSCLRIQPSEGRRIGRVGAGGVHHVAFRVSDDTELDELTKRVESAGISTSGFVDRFYFHSVYFREPGGVLFELATDGPGFASDEPMAELGNHLALPPFLEPRRAEIEAGLKSLT